jgi:hypothetical protein
MIDYIKYEIDGSKLGSFDSDCLLEWSEIVKSSTGEVGKYAKAYYQGLTFKMYNPTQFNPLGRLTVQGSVHKYWNDGQHNFNDFTKGNSIDVFRELETKFDFSINDCVLMALELGVNIEHEFDTKQILDHLLMYRKKEFAPSKVANGSIYLEANLQRHIIKAYNKTKDYEKKGFYVGKNLFRFEKKYLKLQELKDLGIITVTDLLQIDFRPFAVQLVEHWNTCLFSDWNALKGTKNEVQYSSMNYWRSLSKENFKYHVKQLNALIDQSQDSVKKRIAELIEQKAFQLCAETTQINPYSCELIKVGHYLPEAKLCIVTGLNISMQKDDSKMLSHTGIKYYLNNDFEEFRALKEKFLSDNWSSADLQTQISEIAHNIRNTDSNRNISEKRRYPEPQINLLRNLFC